MKKCNKCLEEKEITSFYKAITNVDGLKNQCKQCIIAKASVHYNKNKNRLKEKRNSNKEHYAEIRKKTYLKNHKKRLEYRKLYYHENKEKEKESKRAYRLNNKERVATTLKDWRVRNKTYINSYDKKRREEKPEIHRIKNAKRRACVNNNSLLSDKCKNEIAEIYKEAVDKKLEVDHIIPLIHKNVCGLHVPWNFQLLSKTDNCSKGNKFDGTYENESWRSKVPNFSSFSHLELHE